VHSDLSTLVKISVLDESLIKKGVRVPGLHRPALSELAPFADAVFRLRPHPRGAEAALGSFSIVDAL